MIWAFVSIGAVVAGVAIWRLVAVISGFRGLGWLMGMGTSVSAVALGVVIVMSGNPTASPAQGFSHAQLDADRVMTQQMAVAFGPGMDAVMEQDGMLLRSGDTAYVDALNQHISQFAKSLGQAP